MLDNQPLVVRREVVRRDCDDLQWPAEVLGQRFYLLALGRTIALQLVSVGANVLARFLAGDPSRDAVDARRHEHRYAVVTASAGNDPVHSGAQFIHRPRSSCPRRRWNTNPHFQT
jgi:hypothetical protein